MPTTMTTYYKVNMAAVTVQLTDSDGCLLKKATAHLPAAIEDLGAQSGEAEWKQIEECFRDVAVKLNRSPALKAEFMRCSIIDYSQNLSDADKIEIVRQIFQQLKDERDEKRGLQYGARRPAGRSAG